MLTRVLKALRCQAPVTRRGREGQREREGDKRRRIERIEDKIYGSE